MSEDRGHRRFLTATIACALLLSVYTVVFQVRFMDFQGGLAWYERVQWERTVQVMNNEQGTPWQYRLFTDTIVYGTVRTFEAIGVPRPIGAAFVLIRLLQNLLLFTLAAIFYRRLGLNPPAALFGISLLAWGMCHGLYDNDMTFNTYTDVSLFFAAALLILRQRFRWLLPLMAAAALNRETSGCIPLMLLLSQLRFRPRLAISREALVIAALCFAIWAAIVGGMRLPFVFGHKPYIVPTAGASPPIDLLIFNLTWWRTWVFLVATLGLLPLFALAAYHQWPAPLQRFFWAIVPLWFPVHFVFAHAPETRLFFVPLALLFVPGALFLLQAWPPPALNPRPHPP